MFPCKDTLRHQRDEGNIVLVGVFLKEGFSEKFNDSVLLQRRQGGFTPGFDGSKGLETHMS